MRLFAPPPYGATGMARAHAAPAPRAARGCWPRTHRGAEHHLGHPRRHHLKEAEAYAHQNQAGHELQLLRATPSAGQVLNERLGIELLHEPSHLGFELGVLPRTSGGLMPDSARLRPWLPCKAPGLVRLPIEHFWPTGTGMKRVDHAASEGLRAAAG